MRDYWMPNFKWQLVEWLKKYYPNENWAKMPKRRLYAIYLAVRDNKNKVPVRKARLVESQLEFEGLL